MPSTFSRRPWLPLATIFLVIMLLLLILHGWLKSMQVDYTVLMAGNAILFLATLISFQLFRKSLQNNQAQHILRMVYGGIFAKLAICVLAAFTYILVARNAVDKIALFVCFGLYFIYTFTEVKVLMQISKEQKNA